MQSPTGGQIAFLEACPQSTGYQAWQFFAGTPPRFLPASSPYVTINPVMIRNTTTGKCLAIAPAEQVRAYTRVRQYPCGPDDKRRWRVSRVVVP